MDNTLLQSLGRNFIYGYGPGPDLNLAFWPALGIGLVICLLVIWTIVWKGIALWKSARSGQKGWFVALLILNTVGILDILYIYVFSKKKRK